MSLSEHPLCRVIAEHANTLGSRLGQLVVSDLKKITEPLLSGDDTVLTSVWLEICVQVQGEESFFWDAYLQMMRDAALSRLMAASSAELEMLWMQTEAGWDWTWDVVHCGDEPPPPHPGVDDEAIAQWIIREFVIPAAEADDHNLIAQFLQAR